MFEICGYLRASDSQEALQGATVVAGEAYTISDERGYFRLNVRGHDQLQIRHLGYQTMIIQPSELGEDCQPLYFTPDLTTLSSIVINNYITKGIYKNIDGSTIIELPALGILPGLIEPDVLQALQALPGIQSVNETVSNINVRGGTHDQNLVLWDGIKMYQSGHFFGLISAFNPYLVEEVTVTKNGTSAIWGDAVSSMIQIKSPEDFKNTWSTGGGINLVSGDAFVQAPLGEKASVLISGRRSLADLIETPTYQRYFQRAFRDTEISNGQIGNRDQFSSDEKFLFYDYSLKLFLDPSPIDQIRLSIINVYNDVEYQENALNTTAIESKTSGLTQSNLGVGLQYHRNWSPQWQSSLSIYASWYELQALNFDIFNDRRLRQENDVLDTGLKLDMKYTFSPNLYFKYGYQFFEVGVGNLEDISNPLFRRKIKYVLRTHAAYTEMAWDQPENGRNLRIGIRANYIEEFDRMYLEPRLAFQQKLVENLTLEVLGEVKSQTTSQIIDFQTDFLGVEKRRWVLANNRDIPVTESLQGSLGLHYDRGIWLVSAEAYYKEVTGIITSGQGFQNQFEFIRTAGDYRVRGVDLLINQRKGKFSTWLGYSYSENNYSFSQLTPAEFPNNLDIQHVINSGVSVASSNFELSLGANWHSGKPYTATDQNILVENDILYLLPNQERLPDYLRIDFSATYRFNLGSKLKAMAGISAWNMLDVQNIINIYYRAREDQVDQIERTALKFTPNAVFRISY